MSGKPEYRPEIDWLRAISVVAVVLFHARFAWCPGGFVGVDVFFVLSGFLITSLIRRDLDQNKFSMINFWERRIRRILPALVGVLIPVQLVGVFLLSPSDLAELGVSTIYQSLLMANVFFWKSTGYFAGPAELKPLLHSWSLAVEEQFYLAFPLFLYVVHRYFRKVAAGTLVFVAVVLVVSFGMNVYAIYRWPSATFFLIPTRAWEILSGAMIALLPTAKWSNKMHEVGSAMGVAAIVLPIFLYSSKTLFPGWAAAIPVVGTAAFIYFNSDQLTASGKFMASKPIVGVGLISYSLYLWHWPIFAYLRYSFINVPVTLMLAAIIASFVLAVLSYKFIESPFRKRKLCRTRTSIFAFASCCSLGVMAVGTTFSTGLPGRFESDIATCIDDSEYTGDEFAFTGKRPFVRIGVLNRPPQFLLWGDSHALSVASTLDRVAKRMNLGGSVAAVPSTVPIPGLYSKQVDPAGSLANTWNQSVLEYIEKENVKCVIIVARWNCYFDGYTSLEKTISPVLEDSKIYAVHESKHHPLSQAHRLEIAKHHWARLVSWCETRQIYIHVFLQVPECDSNSLARDFVLWKRFPRLNGKPVVSPIGEVEFAVRQQVTRSVLNDESPYCNLIAPAENMFDNGELFPLTVDFARYKDIHHLTRSGANETFSVPFESILQKHTRIQRTDTR